MNQARSTGRSLLAVALLAVLLASVMALSSSRAASAAGKSAAGSPWSVKQVPGTVGLQNDYLASVSCVSSSFCVAVGYYNNGSINQNLILTWNGAKWNVDASPSLSDPIDENNRLTSVSCVSTTYCVAVGYYDPEGIERLGLLVMWNGFGWSLQDSPSLSPPSVIEPFSVLTSVSCASNRYCVAGGYFSGPASLGQVYLLTWNASTWTIDDSPSLSVSGTSATTSHDFISHVQSISCVSGTFCVAAGSYFSQATSQRYYQVFVLTWNGTTWSLDSSASLSTSSSVSNMVMGISCTGPGFCVVVGYTYTYVVTTVVEQLYRDFILTWNGSAWSMDDASSLSVSGNAESSLASVSCASPSFCAAAGYSWPSGSNGPYVGLVLTWNGSTWTLYSPPPLSTLTSEANVLNAVSCASPIFCVAVGSYESSNGILNLILVWNGSAWSLDDSASLATSGPQQDYLYSISCVSQSYCVAVGSYQPTDAASENLILTWNGAVWSVDDSASLSPAASDGASLDGVSCASPSFCVAVGYYESSANTFQNLVLTWNGSTWSLDDSASLSPSNSQGAHLTGVSCASTSFCVAVGAYALPPASSQSMSMDQDLVLTWNGSTWSLDSSPSLSTSTSQGNNMNAVSCASASYCVAVGYYALPPASSQSPSIDQNLVLTWDGTTWSLDSSPSLSSSVTQTNALNAVSCASPSFCVAVGYYENSDGMWNVVLTWNGAAWSRDGSESLSVPEPPATGFSGGADQLNGVSCAAADYCVAVGSIELGTSTYQNVIVVWNGASWSVDRPAALSAPGSQSNYLDSVSCPSVTFCAAAGYFFNGAVNQPLVLSGTVPQAPHGYWFVARDGGIFSFGDAKFYGSMGGKHLNKPIVGMASTPDGGGYWFVASDGGIFSFGDAKFYGSMGNKHLNAPIVGMASTPDGGGYWFVASDGGIFSFGDAKFYGSMGNRRLNAPIVGMAATPGGGGYWFVASDGGIFSFGDAKFYGSMGNKHLNAPIVGMASTPDGGGYWFVASDGGIFSFGDAKFYGSMGGRRLNAPIVGMASTPDGMGYWFVASDGGIFSFGDAKFYGSMGNKHLNAPIVGMASP